MSAVRSRVLIGVMLLSVPMIVGAQKKPPKPGGTPPNPAIAYEGRNNSGYLDLMVMDADGRNQTRLVRGGDNITPSWSPDGEWIAFGRTSVTSPGIYMIRPNGTGLCQIASGRGIPFHSPSWSPRPAANGLYKIVYSDYIGQSVPDLYSVDARCGANVPQNLTNTPTIGEYSPAWSRDDVLAAAVGVTGYESDIHLFDIHVDGQGGVSLAPRVNLTDAGPLAEAGVGSPSWTRDGNDLVVSGSLPPFTDADLWVLSATGSGVATNLTNTPGVVEWRSTWSPDDAYLAFDGNQQAIYRAAVTVGPWSLGEPTVLARPPRGYSHVARPSWRPVP